jgi:O-antigen ligase
VLTLLFYLIRTLGLPILYFGGILTGLLSVFKKASWGLLLMVALIPQPNVFYKLYDFPMGQRFLDFLFLAVMIGIFVNKKGFERTGNSALILIIVLVSYLSLWNSSMNFTLPLPFTTANPMLKPWKSYAFMMSMYLLTFNAMKDDEKQRELLVLVTALVLLFVSIRSYRSYTPGPSFLEDSRAAGPFWIVGLGSNHFGAFIAHYSTVLLGLLILDHIRWRKMLFFAIILISLHPLFFSYSRGAYVAALAVLVFFGLVKKRSLLVLVFVLVIAWQTILPSSVIDRITMTRSEEGGIDQSATIRLNLWDHALNLFKQNPIFGIGFGGYEFTMPEEGVRWKDTHNYYLKMLSEQGIIGFALLLIVLYRAFGSGWKLLKVGKSGFEKGLGLGFMGCVLACASTNLFGDRWSYYELGTYFWVFWGLVDRYIIISRKVNGVNGK